MKNQLAEFIFAVLVIFLLLGCREEMSKGEKEIGQAKRYGQEVLSRFISGDYKTLYACRGNDFRDRVTLDTFVESTESRRKIFTVPYAKVFDVVEKHDAYFVKFKYVLIERYHEGEDVLVIKLVDDGYKCLDLGLRDYFPLNGKLKVLDRRMSE